jgi:hypothetical protein
MVLKPSFLLPKKERDSIMQNVPCPVRIYKNKEFYSMIKTIKPLILLVVLVVMSIVSAGCSTTRHSTQADELPILSQDELVRPYIKLGRIQVTREVYGTDYSISADITAWGLSAVRQEAVKLGADAVMLPEVAGRTTKSGIFPMTEYRATGFAIKFK